MEIVSFYWENKTKRYVMILRIDGRIEQHQLTRTQMNALISLNNVFKDSQSWQQLYETIMQNLTHSIKYV